MVLVVRCLLIAPRLGLAHADEEVQRVVNWLHPQKVLLGNVTIEEVLDALGLGPYDLIMFVAHGTQEGILLSDGLLATSDLIQLLRGSGVQCIFLNSCSSVLVAIRLHDAIQSAAVVATATAVDDAVAMRTGALFAQYVAAGKSWREAYELSKRGDNEYVYINDTMVGSEMLVLMDEIRRSEQRVKEALVVETLQLRSRLETLEAQMQPTIMRRVQWTIGFLLFAYVAYPLSYQDVANYLGITVREALIIAVFVLGLSGVLMMRGVGLGWQERERE